jgi:hypothetical protein
MIRAFPVLLLVLAPLMARAEESWTEAISGEVRAGEDFKADLPGDLVFSLEADAPFGWTIAMRVAGEDPERDLVWPANPPYRFDNVRYLETSYGKTPEQMLQWNPRRFSFYDDPAAAEAAERWIEAVVLWPTGEEPPMRPDPKGVGVFNILESRIGEVDGHPAVTWLRFEVRLAVEP